jgi:cytochrome c peroxidase
MRRYGLVAFLVVFTAWCQNLGSLKRVKVPQADFSAYVADPNLLVVLGKALFWDMQLSSDGRVACASCHFHAGADHRLQNQLSNPIGSFIPNYTLTAADFPFHQLADPNDNRSAVLGDSPERSGSSGMFRRLFSAAVPGDPADSGQDAADMPEFSLAGLNVRQVTVRNTPTVINSVFNFRNFWDGRASNIFTGLTPFGDSDTRANALRFSGGQVTPEKVRIQNASLASQAVGPPVSNIEMAYDGRTWAMLGQRILALRPLALQMVAADDSVLGPLANLAGRGLAPQSTYLDLVQAAFLPAWWTGGTGQAETNFSLFFGLAIQAYESTLIADDTRFDRFQEGDRTTLTPAEQAGMQLFGGRRADCTQCHTGAEFTLASYTGVNARGVVDRGRGNGVDTGFFRTGVRPAPEDSGLGGTDDFGNPFSLAVAQSPGAARLVNGTFRTPGLRNVEFTGPYFHNGGQATLEQVVDFYSRGSDFPAGRVGPGIRRLGFTADERTSLVAFLKSLSDDRVRFERAPFDHPELCVPAGQNMTTAAGALFPLSAADKWAGIPAVGRSGNAVPLQTYEELLQGLGNDGSRAHTLTDTCGIQ